MSLPLNFDLQAELAKCKTAEDLAGKNVALPQMLQIGSYCAKSVPQY